VGSEPEGSGAEGALQPVGSGARPSVLVLDDERDLLDLLTLVLERRGFRVHATADGNRASRLLRDVDFAVALVDLMMPGLSGPAFLRETSLLAPPRRPSVVVMSALRRDLAEQEISGLPYFALLSKPFELAALPDLIARAAAARLDPRG